MIYHLIFYCILFCHACNLFTKFYKKKGPGGYLIRVDLIRFPGSIPGAMQDVQQLTYSNYTRGKCTNYKLVLDTYKSKFTKVTVVYLGSRLELR